MSYNDAETCRDDLLELADNLELKGKLNSSEAEALRDAATLCYDDVYTSLSGLGSAYVDLTDVTGLFKAAVQLAGMNIRSTGELFMKKFTDDYLYTLQMTPDVRSDLAKWATQASVAEESADTQGIETGAREQAAEIDEKVSSFPWKQAGIGALVGFVAGPIIWPTLLVEGPLLLLPAAAGFGIGTGVGKGTEAIKGYFSGVKTKVKTKVDTAKAKVKK